LDFDYFDFKGEKHLIARSGWSKQGGLKFMLKILSQDKIYMIILFEMVKNLM
jgi:dimethylsulfoniopropionate demethylase